MTGVGVVDVQEHRSHYAGHDEIDSTVITHVDPDVIAVRGGRFAIPLDAAIRKAAREAAEDAVAGLVEQSYVTDTESISLGYIEVTVRVRSVQEF